MKLNRAAVCAFLGLTFFSAPSLAQNSTEGIVVYNPIDGVTVMTVSTKTVDEPAAADAPSVIVSNTIVNVIVSSRFHPRCGIGVPYPWQRRLCGDPLYPF
jgi:hypothetical protein